MNEFEKASFDLVGFIQQSPSCYHVVNNVAAIYEQAGLTRLSEGDVWELAAGRSYYVTRNNSSIIAFRIPKEEPTNYQIVASHSDSPTFKIKEHEEMKKAGHYVELNVEKYGGMLCNPWFDRPLSIAGRAVVEENGALVEKLVNFDRDLVMLPNMAIHMNRQANEGVPIKVQTDMLPIFGDETAEGGFMKLLAKELQTTPEQILGTDLFLYDRSRASFWGANHEFFSCQKLDDLQCAYSSVKAFLAANNLMAANEKSINLCCIFDNEEVGSGTKQGADSTFLTETLERIADAMGYGRQKHFSMIASGFMLSSDNGHAVHPNHPEKADPTNQPFMNGGVLIKYNANQKYTTDSVSAAIFKLICKNHEIPFQVYVNHSDVAGGSTLGNIANSHVSLNTIDIGTAQLAMHSPYETGGIKDTWYLEQAMKAFYDTHIAKASDGSYHLG